nr:MAG TPA: hypothetical protein [Caudoviricetes sp.]
MLSSAVPPLITKRKIDYPRRHRSAYSSRMSFSLNFILDLNRLDPKDIRGVLRSSDLTVLR